MRVTSRTTGVAVIVLLLLGILSGCSSVLRDERAVEGSGAAATDTRDLGGGEVRAVVLRGLGELVVTQGTTQQLRIEADDNLLPHIRTTVEGNRLTISWQYDSSIFTPKHPVTFELTVREIDHIQITGAGLARADGLRIDDLRLNLEGAGRIILRNLQASSVNATIDGAGQVELSGSIERQTLTINGSGSLRGGEAASREVQIDINGAGAATVRVSDRLDVKIDGGGVVRYVGDPQVTEDIDGIGRVTKITRP